MPDDEIMSISRHEDDSDKVTSLDDEMVGDKIIDQVMTELQIKSSVEAPNNQDSAALENLLGYDKKIRRALHTEVPDILSSTIKIPTDLLPDTVTAKILQLWPPKLLLNTISSFDDSNEEDQPVTLVNENTALIQEEPQTSGASSDANPLDVKLHSTDETELEEPPVKKLRVIIDIPALTP
nr:hypothetical protein [Tanacetum cinerariifolium]